MLRAYMAYDRIAGSQEGAWLVWAHSSREARALAHDVLRGNMDTQFVDVATRWMRHCTHPQPAEPCVILPKVCASCDMWHDEPPNDEGYCEDCQEEIDADGIAIAP